MFLLYETEDGKIAEILEGISLLYSIQKFKVSKNSPEPTILTNVHRDFSQSFQEIISHNTSLIQKYFFLCPFQFFIHHLLYSLKLQMSYW